MNRVGDRADDGARPVPPGRGLVVPRAVRRADPAAADGMAGDRVGAEHPDRRPDRLGQDPRRLPGRARPPLADARDARRASGSSTSRRSRRSTRTSGGTCSSPSRGSWNTLAPRATPLPPLTVGIRSGDTPSHGAGQDGPQAARHPDHHARIAPPDADQPGPGHPPRGLARDRRRDPRRLRQQARRVPRAVARAARRRSTRRGSSGSACRPPSARSRRSPATWADSGGRTTGRSSPGP